MRHWRKICRLHYGKSLVLRHTNTKVPPAAATDEFKKQLGGAMENYVKENPEVKFNGLYVDQEGVGICDVYLR
jgi:hypothetical protein